MSKENDNSQSQTDYHKNISKPKLIDLLRSLSEEREADIFLYSRELQRESANTFINLVQKEKHKKMLF